MIFGCVSGGGGSGGGVYVAVKTLSGSGTISANGMRAGTAYPGFSDGCRGGGGGGGRVAVYYGQLSGFNPASQVTVTGGDGGDIRDGGVGTIYLSNGVAPVTFGWFDPQGLTNGVIDRITFHAGNPLAAGSLGLGDLTLTRWGGGTLSLASVAQTGVLSYRVMLANPVSEEGIYRLVIGTDVVNTFGGGPLGPTTNEFVIDWTPPVAPMATNYAAAPATNWIQATSAVLRGTREDESSVWQDETQRVARGSGTWTGTVSLAQGLNAVMLHGRDAAGNRSVTNTWNFLADTVAPVVTAVNPANGVSTAAAPAAVVVTYAEAVSGLDAARSQRAVTKGGVAVPGEWTATTNLLTFTPAGTLADGTYVVAVRLCDALSNTGTAFSSTFAVDTAAPAAPVVNPATSPTTINQQTIAGTREANTAILRDGTQVVASGASTNWSYVQTLTNGWNSFALAARDAAGNASAATNVQIRYNNVAPGAVAVTGQVAGVGTQITLGWSGYDELAAGGDIAGYQIYQADASFANAGQATQIGVQEAGRKSFVVTGLARNVAKHYAVIARDSTGLCNSNVSSVALAPVDVVAPPDPTGMVFTCGATNLVLEWSASADPHADLAGYRVYVTNAAVGVEYAATNRVHGQPGLVPSSSYVFRVTSFDATGNESAGLSATGYTVMPNPVGLRVTPYDGYVEMSWAPVQPSAYVKHYAIYASTSAFASVSGMTARATTAATNAGLAGFQNGVANWFAVTTVNPSGGENPAVTPVAATTLDDVTGPALANLKFNGYALSAPATKPGSFTVTGGDPAGMSRVEVRVKGALLETVVAGTTNFSAFWNVANTTNDGAHAVEVTAYDTRGNRTVLATNITVALAKPVAPVLTQPSGVTAVSRAWQTVSGTGAVYATAVVLSRNGQGVTGSTVNVTSDGRFDGSVTLAEGTNAIRAAAVNRAGTGTWSQAATFVMDTSLPPAPLGLAAASREGGAIRLSWNDPQGDSVMNYQIYRAMDAFSTPAAATLVGTAASGSGTYSDLPAADGMYHYRVSAVNRAGSEGPLSAEAASRSDRSAPRIMAVAYEGEGVCSPAENRYGRGQVRVRIEVSEPLVTSPFFSLNPSGGTPIAVSLQSAGTNAYAGSFEVDGSQPCGTALAVYSGRDLAGNRGTEIDSGAYILLDTCGPVVSELLVTPSAPIRNSASSPTSVSAVVTFPADDLPVGAPQLAWSLETTRTQETAVALAPLTYRSWGGTFSLPAGAGNPAEYLRFTYRGVDDLGNTGTTIQAESRFQTYQGGLPPYGAPEGLTGRALPGGEVELTWNAVAGAVDYAVFRGPASNALSFRILSGGALVYTEDIGDGTNWYAVASLRSANGQMATSALSQAVRVVADAAAPPAPQGLGIRLQGNGVALSWQAVASEPVKYQVYRSVQNIADLDGMVALATNVAKTNAVDANPMKGAAYYAVAAVDAAGNRSAASGNAYTNLSLLPVNQLGIEQQAGQRPVVTWSHANAAGIDGFRVYADAQMLAELSSATTSLVDSAYSSGSRLYGVAAVDEVEGTAIESVRRTVQLPELSVNLPTNAVLKRGVMNRLVYAASNGAVAVTNVRLKVTAAGVEHQSDLFALPADGTGAVAVVIGGYSNLPPVATISNRLEQIPNEGEWIRILSTSTVPVGDEVLTAEVNNDELSRGTAGKVRFVLHNTSSEEMEIVLAENGAPSPEVRVKLETEEGMVLSSGSAQQLMGSGVLTLANRQTVARIPAGTSFTSGDISLTIPADAPDAVVLRLEIDRLHYHSGEDSHVQIGGVQSTRKVSLQETIYSTMVTNVAPRESWGETNVLIQGRAVNRTTGAGQANVPVKLTISLDGFERTSTAYADASGNWSYSFAPLANESGVYSVWAVHPLRVDKPVQDGFVIKRVKVSPAVVNVALPLDYPQAVDVSVTSSRGLTLSNLSLRCTAADQPNGNWPAGVHVDLGDPVAELAGGSTASLRFTLQGESPASTGNVVVVVVGDGSGTNGWGRVTVNYQFTEARPALTWSPNYVQTGVAISNRTTEIVTMKNAGYAALNEMGLALWETNGQPAPAWVQMNVPSNLGTLAVGEQREVGITFAPTNGVGAGSYQFVLRVTAANHATKDVNLFVGVDSSGRGGALFKVSDIYTGTTNQNGVVQGLAGARIALEKESGAAFSTNRTTDALGEAYFEDLPAGAYIYRVTADRHEACRSRIWVKPGVTGNTEVFLQSPLVTVEWSVVPTTVEDEYQIVLSATYETQVPAPVVLLEPVSVQLPDMKAGDVFNGEFTMKNYGLIRAESLAVQIPESDEYYRYELMVKPPETLEANQVVKLPYRVTCLKAYGGSETEAGGGGTCGCYRRAMPYSYCYHCINHVQSTGAGEAYWVGECISCGGNGSSGTSGGTGFLNLGVSAGAEGTVSSGSPASTSLPGGSMGCVDAPDPENIPCTPLEPTGSSVVLAGGGYHDEEVDMDVKTLGRLFSVRRYYFDRKWQMDDLFQRIEFNYAGEKLDSVTLAGATLTRTATENEIQPGEKLHDSDGDVLECLTNGYRMTWAGGEWARYDANGRRLAKGDRQGRQIQYGYEENADRVVAIYDHYTNQILWIEYASAGWVTRIRDRATGGRSVSYDYDGAGRLTNVVGVLGGTMTYQYDANGRLIHKTAPGGYERFITYQANGTVASVLDGEGRGKNFDFSYDAATGLYYSYTRTSGGRVLERWYNRSMEQVKTMVNGQLVDTNNVPNPDGSTMTYNENGKLLRVSYPDGVARTYEYNGPYGTLSRMVDEAGAITLYGRDAKGNATSIVEAVGTALARTTINEYNELGLLTRTVQKGGTQAVDSAVSFTYDDQGNIAQMTDAEGHVTRYAYDGLGNATSISNASGEVWRHTYDAMGNRLTIVDPVGRVVSNTYDQAEHLVQVRDASGLIQRYEYDGEGWPVRAVDPFGRTQEKSYDDDGQLIAIRNSDGTAFTYSYRWNGQVTSLTDENGQANKMAYDDLGRLTDMTAPDGTTAHMIYDDADRVVQVQTPAWQKHYSYDSRGAMTGMWYQSDHVILSNRYQRDSSGHVVRLEDAEGHVRRWSYDLFGRIAETVDPLGQTNRFEYDVRDNLVAVYDALGRATRYEYSRGNRMTRRKLSDGSEIRMAYDVSGRLSQSSDPNGNVVRWSYDGAGRVITTRVFVAETDVTPAKTIRFTYDAQDRMLSCDDGMTASTWCYDDSNRTVRCTVDYGAFSAAYAYAFDAEGRKTSLTGPGGWTNLYHYGADRVLSGMEIPGEGSISMQRVPGGMEQHIQYPGGVRKSLYSDPLLGIRTNVAIDMASVPLMAQIHERNLSGLTTRMATDAGDYQYCYDAMQQLRGVEHPSLGAATYTYDAVGNRETSTGIDGGAWRHDGRNRLTNAPIGDFAYDAAGNMIRRTVDGETQTLVYEPAGNLAEIRDAHGQVVARYAYDSFGRRIKKEVNGVTTWFLYADEGLIAEFDEHGEVIRQYGYYPDSTWNIDPLMMKSGGQTYYYLNDALGAPWKLVTRSGAIVWSARYEAFGAAHVDSSSQVENPVRASGQYYDAESGLHYNTHRYYDPRLGRYVQSDPLGEEGGLNLYSFVRNSPLQYIDPQGLLIVANSRQTSTGEEKTYRSTSLTSHSLPNRWYANYEGPPEHRYDYYMSPEDAGRLKAKASGGVSIFVAGFSAPYDEQIERAHEYEEEMRKRLHDPEFEVVVMPWHGEYPLLEFNRAMTVARDVAVTLSRFVRCLEKAGVRVSVVAHSAGNYIVAESLLVDPQTRYETWLALQGAVGSRDMWRTGRYGHALETQVGQLRYTSGFWDIATGKYGFGIFFGKTAVGAKGIDPKQATANTSRVDYNPRMNDAHSDIMNEKVLDEFQSLIQRMRLSRQGTGMTDSDALEGWAGGAF